MELGRAEVRNVFRITGVGMVAGCYVLDGKMQRNAQMRLPVSYTHLDVYKRQSSCAAL